MLDNLKNLSITERLLVGFSIVLVGASVYFHAHYKSILFPKGVDEEGSIAQIVKVSKHTRRRSPESYEFEELGESDYVSNGDSIYSGEGSQILVKFKNGTRILIGEQSLVVLRAIDGSPDVKVEKGALSGSFEQADEIEVLTDKESVIINGEKDAQFSVVSKADGGLVIGSFKKNIKVSYKGKEMNLKNQTAHFSKNKATKISKNASDGKTSKDIADNKAAPKVRKPSGIGVEAAKMDNVISLDPPYPQLNQMFIHKTGGRVPVYPKQSCSGDCELKILVEGQVIASRTFKRDMVPLIYLTIKPGVEFDVKWEFVDGDSIKSSSFSIKKNNEANFKRAFLEKIPVEVMN